MSKPKQTFFQWFDSVSAEALASPIGKRMLDDDPNWEVVHTGGGCLAWRLPVGEAHQILISADSALPESEGEPCYCGIYDEDGAFNEKECANLAEALSQATVYFDQGKVLPEEPQADMGPTRTALVLALDCLKDEHINEHQRREAISMIEEMLAQRGCEVHDSGCRDGYLTTLCDIIIRG